MDLDTAATFERQLGLITTRQARSLGISADGIRHRVRTGVWERVDQGLYRLRGTPSSWEQVVLGAVLLAGEPAWASHSTAALLWGFSGFDEEPVEVTVTITRRPRVPGARVHRSGTVEAADVREVGVVPALSAARTIVDLSSRLDDRGLAAMIDDGLRRRVLTLGGLHAVARRLPTIAPGRSPRRVARLLASRTPGFHPGDSELEAAVLRTLLDHGLPEPVRQFRVVVGDRTYFLDLAYPERKLAIEVDGFDYHRGRGVFDRDRSRQNDLIGAGWTVLRFTSASTPDEIVTAVRRFLFGR